MTYDTGNSLPSFIHKRYKLIERIGGGGQGEVYKAYDNVLSRDVALKICSSTQSAFVKQFISEAMITGELEHPSIIPIHDFGKDEHDQHFYVMPYSPGERLSDKIKSSKTVEDRLRLLENFKDICNAIGYAHSKGYIHRDLKPDNIIIGTFGETYVFDWGLSHKLGEKSGVLGGSASYSSPEYAQARLGGDSSLIDKRSDVFSLGIILYEILTGERPFTGIELEVFQKMMAETPKKINKIVRGIPYEYIACCMKALKKDPDERFHDAKEFADALINETIILPWWLKIIRNIQKHKVKLISSIVFILILVAIILFFAGNKNRELNNISHARTLNILGTNMEKEKDFNRAYFYQSEAYLKSPEIKSAPYSRERMAELFLKITPLQKQIEFEDR
ncbi:MAG: serine/threonine-protein kinase, partial [bacterium]|nr:serine/threonine-protein kinase [bacterium]